MHNVLENIKTSQLVYENIEDIDLTDVIDVEFLQKFQDTFSDATGMSSIILNKDDKWVTQPSNFNKFCLYTKKSCEGAKRCARSDSLGAKKAWSTKKPAVYYCENGLIDFAAPIILNGKKIGAILGGQVLAEPPDENKYNRLAEEIGVDAKPYLAALKEIKIIPIKQIEAAADLLFVVSTQISKIGFQRLMLMNISDILHQELVKITANTEELNALAVQVSNTQNILNKEIHNVIEASQKIIGIAEDITSLAGKSRLLGLNASIEAARVGKDGVGFSIVAKEIQRLSDLSKNTVDKIRQLTKEISQNANTTVEISVDTLKASKQQEEAAKQIMDAIEELVNLSKQLTNLSSDI